MTAVDLYLVFLRAVVLSFSGFASVPLVRDALVIQQAVLTDTQLNDAIAISQASPGPLGLYVVIVGYFAGGIGGAIAGSAALATPALLAIPIAVAVQRGRAEHIRGASSGIVIASCMLMLVAGVRLAPEAAPTFPYALIALAGFALLALTRVQPVWVILGAAAFGTAF